MSMSEKMFLLSCMTTFIVLFVQYQAYRQELSKRGYIQFAERLTLGEIVFVFLYMQYIPHNKRGVGTLVGAFGPILSIVLALATSAVILNHIYAMIPLVK